MISNRGTNIIRGLAGAAACLALASAAGTTAYGQLYQYGYGGSGTDAARGVISLSNDDVVITGETNSYSPGGDYDAYLVKTNRCGQGIWARHYEFGGDDRAHKVRATSDGGFIIVGETEDLNSCCTHNDIFLLKVDATGLVQWAHTYGGSGEEIGSDVQVVNDGYIVAGRTNSFGQGMDDGYLMKTDASGNLTWARTYGGANTDIFMSCVVAANGDIVATGATRSFSGNGTSDLWLTRVFQANGQAIMPGLPVTYGGSGDDIGWSVVECTNGDIAVAGGSVRTPGYGEGYLLRTTNVLLPVRDRTIGGANNVPGNWDEFTELKPLSSGNFIVTGLFLDPTGGFGDWDMYVAEVDANFVLVSSVVHGGPDADQGWAIVEANSPPAPYYIAAGLSNSFNPPMDAYVVRQLPNGTSACSTRYIETVVGTPRYSAVSVNAVSGIVNAHCPSAAHMGDELEEDEICTNCNLRNNIELNNQGHPEVNPNVEAPVLGIREWHDGEAAVAVSTPAGMNNNR